MRMKENENYSSTKVVDRETQSMRDRERERENETCRWREQENRTKTEAMTRQNMEDWSRWHARKTDQSPTKTQSTHKNHRVMPGQAWNWVGMGKVADGGGCLVVVAFQIAVVIKYQLHGAVKQLQI